MSTTARLKLDSQTVLVSLLTIRLFNSLTLRTLFQPDEYYQALEPAWELTRGSSSGAWITWEWIQHLRSAIHPAIFSVVYHVTNIVVPSSAPLWTRNEFLLSTPKAAQAVIAAYGDWYTGLLAEKVYGNSQLAFVTLCITVLNPWQWFCSTRTFSNGLEATLTAVALFYWPLSSSSNNASPKPGQRTKSSQSPGTQEPRYSVRRLRTALVLAAAATIIRPTNLLIWIVLSLYILLHNEQNDTRNKSTPKNREKAHGDTFVSRLSLIVRESILCGGLVLAVSAGIDRLFYGVWTFPALNFLYFNVVQSLAVFYGNNDWHYYLSQGYPLLLTTALPFAVIGLYRIFRHSPSIQLQPPATIFSLNQLATICIVLPAALSILSHKEVRFIYPILAPLQIIAAAPVHEFFQPIFSTRQPPKNSQPPPSRIPRILLLLFLLTTNATIAIYTSQTHNSGLIALPNYIRTEFQTHYHNHHPPQNLTLALLMPCHSLPWRSHLLNPPTPSTPGIQAWALTCEPPLHLHTPASKKSYLDEADIFYTSPALWIQENMSHRPPRTFSGLAEHERHREPGLYTRRNTKKLGSSRTHTQQDPDPGLDITDLLPHLRTSPDRRSPEEKLIKRPWPHYLAFFAQLEPTLTALLEGSGYTECWRVFNSHWHDDGRRQGDVVVWCLFPDRASKVNERLERERVMPDRPGGQQVL